jgi:ADP-ribosyl-[dinitrogen reductase] hydrolase
VQFLHKMIPSPVHGTLAGQPTDDSEPALALARSLIERHSYNREHVAGAYTDWYASGPFDVGGTIRRALLAAEAARIAGTSLADAARAAASRESQAYGALMRQSPLAIWGWQMDPRDLDTVVQADTALTHPHPVCIASSAVFIVALSRIVRGGADGHEAYTFGRDWHRHCSCPSAEVTSGCNTSISKCSA